MRENAKIEKKDRILLFIPGYNCEKQLPRVLKKLNKEVMEYIDEIIFVNNRSTDNTEVVALECKKKYKLPLKVLRNDHNYNLGGSHKVAFQYAMDNGFDYVIILHGDDQGDINDILPVLKSGEYGKHDCMLGSRFMRKNESYSTFRTFGNKVYNSLFSAVVGRKILDLGSGLNLYSVKMLRDKFYFKFPDRLTFNYCMILASNYYNHDIAFFPITWREEDQVSNVKMVSQATNVLGMLGKYAVNHEFIRKELREEPIKEYTYKEIKKSEKK